VYERRPSYYQEAPPPAQTYPYENQRDSYYQRSSFAAPAHPGYEHGYPQTQYDVRFQQHVGLDHNAFNRKRRGNLPKEATNYLKAWFARNRASPYPTEDQKIEMCRDTGLSLNQVRFDVAFGTPTTPATCLPMPSVFSVTAVYSALTCTRPLVPITL
jgi:hypothetical protein